VHVSVAGFPGGVDASYKTAPTSGSASVYHNSFLERFWTSWAAVILVVGLISGLIGWTVSRIVRPRGTPLRERMAEFVSLRRPKTDRKQSSVFAGKLSDGAEKSLERTRWWAGFKEELDIAEIGLAPGQIVLLTFFGMVMLAWFAVTVTGSPIFALSAVAVPLSVRAAVRRKLDRVRLRFAEQLPDNLQVLASAMRAGHSFVGALAVVVEDAEEPSQTRRGGRAAWRRAR
jgi:Flp pilus assembly protein TadB